MSLALLLLALFPLASLGLVIGSATGADEESSVIREHTESLSMKILTYSGAVNLLVEFDVGHGPLDSANFDDLSFMSLLITGSNSNMAYAGIMLSTVFLDIDQAREEADLYKTLLEHRFNTTLNSSSYSVSSGTVDCYYQTEECNFQRFQEVFLEYMPSEGFSRMLKPRLIRESWAITFWYNGRWSIQAAIGFPNCFKPSFGQEYVVSLKELMGYSGGIQASPQSTRSTVDVKVCQADKEFTVQLLGTIPANWDMEEEGEEQHSAHGRVTTHFFRKDITKSSTEDVSFRFTLGPPPALIDPLTAAILVILVIVTILGLTGLITRRRTRREVTPHSSYRAAGFVEQSVSFLNFCVLRQKAAVNHTAVKPADPGRLAIAKRGVSLQNHYLLGFIDIMAVSI